MKKNKILSLSLALVSVFSTAGCSMEELFTSRPKSGNDVQTVDYGHELDPEIHELIADSRYQALSDEDGIRFETALTDEERAAGTQAALYDTDDNEISVLYDDGTHGDRIAGDGIYALRYKPDVNTEKTLSYKVKIGQTETEPVDIRYFDELTENDFDNLSEVKESFEQLASEFQDENGFVPQENRKAAVDKAAQKAEQMVKNGEAVEYRVNDVSSNVVVKLSSGITYVYKVNEEGMDGTVSVDSEISVATCQPWLKSYNENKGLRSYMTCADDGADAIADEFDNITFDRNLDDTSVNPETLKTFSSDQIILWHGHGDYDVKLHSYIYFNIVPDITYRTSDYVEDALVVENGYLAFTYKYVDAYCGDMTGSFIYIGCCMSGYDGVLASSFRKKNCNAVIANTQSIYTTYNISMIQAFSEYLASKNKFLFFIPLEYRTAGEALEKAKKKHGKDDGSDRHAAPVIFGNAGYRLSDAVEGNLEKSDKDIEFAEGSLLLDKMYVSVSAGGTASVSVTKYPKGYSESDFIWTIEDTSVASVTSGTVTGISAGSTVLIIKSSDGKFKQYCSVSVSK